MGYGRTIGYTVFIKELSKEREYVNGNMKYEMEKMKWMLILIALTISNMFNLVACCFG